MKKNLREKLEKLEKLISKYESDLPKLKEKAKELQETSGIISVEEFERKILEQDQQYDKLLRVGFLGKVNVGKSSFLNALFFEGEDILPKAATPMTAALTILEYGKNIGAEVDFYTQEDLQKIKTEHKQSNIKLEELKQYQNIQANNIDDLKEKLKDFVGSDGRLMPYTKSVTLKLKDENLKDLQIIDSPGINDPVSSREARTKELLKDCDVVFLISHSGSFLSIDDMILLDRLITKEGVREFHIIASQVDNQLFGDCKDKAQDNLVRVLQKIQEELDDRMKEIFSQQEEKYSKEFFEKIMKSDVICASATAFSLFKNWGNEPMWDENLKHFHTLLQEEYQDFFANDDMAKDHLEKIANLKTIQDILKKIHLEKHKIQEQRQKAFLEDKSNCLQKYIKELINFLETDPEKCSAEKELNQVEQKQAELKKTLPDLNKLFQLLLDDFFEEMEQKFKERFGQELKHCKDLIGQIDKSIKDSTKKEPLYSLYSQKLSPSKMDQRLFTTLKESLETMKRDLKTEFIQDIATLIKNDLIEKIEKTINIPNKEKINKSIVKCIKEEISTPIIQDFNFEAPQDDLYNADILGYTCTEIEDYKSKFQRDKEEFISHLDNFEKNTCKNLIEALRKIKFDENNFKDTIEEFNKTKWKQKLKRYTEIIQELKEIQK